MCHKVSYQLMFCWINDYANFSVCQSEYTYDLVSRNNVCGEDGK